MKIKALIALLCILACLTMFFYGCNDQQQEVKVLNTELTVGATQPFKIVHASDIHTLLTADSDSKKLKKEGKNRVRYFGKNPDQKLDIITDLANENDARIVITGDFMDFISDGNINKLAEFVRETNAIYVPGNHEMEFISPEDEQRLTQAAQRNVRFFTEEINGVVFVGIDNTNHRMTQDQLDRLKSVVESDKPVILLLHVPLFQKDMYDISIQSDGSAYLMAVPEELMTNYSEFRYNDQKADAVTYEAYDYITAQDNIKAILCGHVHFDFETQVGKVKQYVVGTNTARVISIS